MSFAEDSSGAEQEDQDICTDGNKSKPKIYRVLNVTKLENTTDVAKEEPSMVKANDSGGEDLPDQVGAVTEQSSSIPIDSQLENTPAESLKPSTNMGCLGDGKSQTGEDTLILRVTVIAEPLLGDSGVDQVPQRVEPTPSCSRSPSQMRGRTAKRHAVSRSVRKCWFCPMRFRRKLSLANHIRYVHCSELGLFCKHCRKEFKHSYSFFMHTHFEHCTRELSTRNLQSNEFMCEICSLKFAKRDDLNNHKSSHSVETATDKFPSNEVRDVKPFTEGASEIHRYQCPQCSESFSLRKKYEKHLKVVHYPNPFKCSVCSRQFVCKYSYKIHVRSHFKSLAVSDPFVYSQQCDICGFWFDRLHELYQHRDICKPANK